MATPRRAFICASCARSLHLPSSTSTLTRAFSTTITQHAVTTSPLSRDLPRWQQTPPAMRQPHRTRPLPKQPIWRVNEDQALVDEAYDRFVGRAAETGVKAGESARGRDLLPDEIKWLALTHKSFDHGRRGFNDRLAFLGKRIVDLQTSLALLNAPAPTTPSPPNTTPTIIASTAPTSREIFHHPALEGAENISAFAKAAVLERTRLARLARSYGIDKVVRWKPRKSDNLQSSGVDTVLAHTLYSIVGALALQRGGEVAARTARVRIVNDEFVVQSLILGALVE